jgi:cytochrome P450/glutathione S-transferase
VSSSVYTGPDLIPKYCRRSRPSLTTATIYRPSMVSISADPYCELARWVLDRRGIPYTEERHAPLFQWLTTWRERGRVFPGLDTGEATLWSAREIVDCYEGRARIDQKLYPVDAEARTEAEKLFDLFYDNFGPAVHAWTSAYLLPIRSITLNAWTKRVPWWERLISSILYPWLAAAMRRNLGLAPETITHEERTIENILTRVQERLADARRFLMGDEFTAPDLALAALAGPIVFPSENNAALPSLNHLPPAMRAAVERWRARPAGQFILRLCKEEHPPRALDLIALARHGSGRTFKDRLANFLVRPGVLLPVFTFLRRWSPIFTFGKHAIVTRYPDVVEILKRDGYFTIKQANAEKIDRIDGPFILGMDQSPQYDREKAMLLQVVRPGDLENIREFVAQTAATLVAQARPRGRIDVVNGLARIVPLRLVADYFGIPGPNDPTMMRWMRDIFHYIFADLTNSQSVLQDALHSSGELHPYMDAQIALRKSQQSAAKTKEVVLDRLFAGQDTNHTVPNNVLNWSTDTEDVVHNDDVLGRLLQMQDAAHPWLDDNTVRRNLGGVIVGAVDTTSKFVTLAIDELLRRPAFLAEARAAAVGGDVEAVRGFAWEAVRFNPHHPLQVRFCAHPTQIAQGQKRSKKLPARTFAYAATLSAMFDPEVFTNPGDFNPRREVEYLHFGYGLHTCFGRAINGVQIPEIGPVAVAELATRTGERGADPL